MSSDIDMISVKRDFNEKIILNYENAELLATDGFYTWGGHQLCTKWWTHKVLTDSSVHTHDQMDSSK